MAQGASALSTAHALCAPVGASAHQRALPDALHASGRPHSPDQVPPLPKSAPLAAARGARTAHTEPTGTGPCVLQALRAMGHPSSWSVPCLACLVMHRRLPFMAPENVCRPHICKIVPAKDNTTVSHLVCRLPFFAPYPQTVCGSGRYSPAGQLQCEPCPFGTYASTSASAACSSCPATTPFSFMGSTGPDQCVCPAGHACNNGSVPQLCPEGTFSWAGDGQCEPCPEFTVSSAGAETCLPTCPGLQETAGAYVRPMTPTAGPQFVAGLSQFTYHALTTT